MGRGGTQTKDTKRGWDEKRVYVCTVSSSAINTPTRYLYFLPPFPPPRAKLLLFPLLLLFSTFEELFIYLFIQPSIHLFIFSTSSRQTFGNLFLPSYIHRVAVDYLSKKWNTFKIYLWPIKLFKTPNFYSLLVSIKIITIIFKPKEMKNTDFISEAYSWMSTNKHLNDNSRAGLKLHKEIIIINVSYLATMTGFWEYELWGRLIDQVICHSRVVTQNFKSYFNNLWNKTLYLFGAFTRTDALLSAFINNSLIYWIN